MVEDEGGGAYGGGASAGGGEGDGDLVDVSCDGAAGEGFGQGVSVEFADGA